MAFSDSSAPAVSTGNPASTSEAREILARLSVRAVEQGRDLELEDDGVDTYALFPSGRKLTTPIGFSVTLAHK